MLSCVSSFRGSTVSESKIDAVLIMLVLRYDDILIGSNFNADQLKSSSNITAIRDILLSTDLTFVGDEPTNITNTSAIDFFIIRDDSKGIRSGKLETPGLSNHDLIYIFYSFSTFAERYHVL